MLDKKYNVQEKEQKWMEYWQNNNIYEFKPDHREIYSIDTPPPTVNGKIHIGHIFSYSQAEMIARYKRIRGYNVFYPFGFDDNGLPSERLVEKEQGKKAQGAPICDPASLCNAGGGNGAAGFAGCVPGLNGDDEALPASSIELLLQEGALGHILLRPGDKLLLLRRGLRTGGGLFQAE